MAELYRKPIFAFFSFEYNDMRRSIPTSARYFYISVVEREFAST